MKKQEIDLLTIQKNFLKHLYNEKEYKILESLPYNKTEALSRLDIYRNNVFGNFSSVLSSIFSTTKKILGDKKFDSFVKKYIEKHYSTSGNLDDYGNFFPQFLQKNIKTHQINFLGDLAIVELAYYRLFFITINKPTFPLVEFKKIPVENLSKVKFILDESVTIFSSKFPLYKIFTKEKRIAKKNGEFLLLNNINGRSIEEITENEFLFLSLIIRGYNLYQIYNKISKKIKNDFDIGKIMQKFISNKVIVSFVENE